MSLLHTMTAALLLGATPAEPPAAHPRATPPDVRLAAEGRALHPVVVPPGASKPVRAAAADLADYLGRISGATFAVVEGDGATGIAVGNHTNFPALKTGAPFHPEDLFRREDYLVRTHENGAWLLGASDRAAVHAVWDCLHRLGYRLFFLTDTWEVVPSRPDLRLAADAFVTPDYITREAPRGAPWSNPALWKRWKERNRITSDFSLATGHSYDGIISANAKAFEAHPEYRALVGGERRGSKFCISNPDLRQLVVDHAVKAMKANPELDSVSMDPSDGGGWCECEPCAKMGSVSDRVILLANEVATAINALGFGPKYVGIYAYSQHSPPPSVKAHPKVVVSIATSFIRGGYTIEQLVEGWSAKEAVLGVRDYHDVFPWSHDMPRGARGGNLAYLARTIPWFHSKGARFMNSECGDSWGANGLGYWLTPIMLWDVSAAERLDDYIEDFLDKAFGPAREPMREFFRLINRDRAMRTPQDIVGRMYRALAEARDKADSPAVHARLDDLVLYTRYTELYRQYRAATGEARQEAFERIWRHTWRMRKRMMLSTVAICDRDKFRDGSVVVYSQSVHKPPKDLPEVDMRATLEGRPVAGAKADSLDNALDQVEIALGVAQAKPETNPWESDEPYTPAELAGIVREGIASNPILVLEFEPVGFSDDLVPAAPLNLPAVTNGHFPAQGRGSRQFLTWFDKPGAFELGVTGGLIAHYRDRGNVKINLLSPLEPSLEPVARDASVPPDGKPHTVTLATPYEGLHTLQVSDGSDKTALAFPPGLPITIISSMENRPGHTLGGTWSLYFYVPRGTKKVGGFAADLSGLLRDGDGKAIFQFDSMPAPGYFSVPVPEGQDGRLWLIENSSGEKLLMTVPPSLARNARELLLPAEVVKKDSK